MKDRRTQGFKEMFDNLPAKVQERAKAAHRLFLEDPNNSALGLHPLHDTKDNPRHSMAVSIGYRYRAVFVTDEEGVNVWYWIGSHADYDKRFGKNR